VNISKTDFLYRKKIKKFIKQKIANIYNELEYQKDERLNPSNIIYFPFEKGKDSYFISKSKVNYKICEQGLPIPPKHLWLNYGNTEEEYLSGKTQIETLLNILNSNGFALKDSNKILDFGCGAGRMIRWLKPYTEKCEIWGTDISSEHIYWANKYLKPPFNFATTTTIPHLPFEDRYFDLIYAGSVFTHIDDLTDAWLLELRRILSDNGSIYITIHDKHTIELIKDHPIWKDSLVAKLVNKFPKIANGEDNFGLFVTLRGPASQVFYDIDYFCESISNIFNVVSVTPEAYGYQTAVLLKRKN
jgi:SAM-dependent methyltransferase